MLDQTACCGVVVAGRRPKWSRLTDYYDREFRHPSREEVAAALLAGSTRVDRASRRLLREVERRVEGRRMVEIGGGCGAFGRFAHARGWTYTDYDVSAEAVTLVRRLHLDARLLALPAPPDLEPNSVDVVVMWEVIEHVWNVSEYLGAIVRALKPGGCLVLSTPNYGRPAYSESDDWRSYMAPPVHVNFFTESSLHEVLTRVGFSGVTFYTSRFHRDRAMEYTFREVINRIRQTLRLAEPDTVFAIARS